MATYRINFNANSGSGAPGSLSGDTSPQITIDGGTYYYASVKLPSNKPSRTYYNFLGWSSSSSASSAAYAAGGTYTVNTTSSTFVTTLYAVWQHQTAYVYYNANGGSNAPSTQSHWAGYSVTLSGSSPSRNGYTFLGWATSASATTASYQPGGTYSLYTTTTLYAVWKSAASTLTASNGNIGDAITIGITRQNNAYTDTIAYSFGTATGTIVTKTGNASVTWTPPIALASEIPNSSTATCTLTCTTYNGDTLIGTTTKTITLTVPQSLAPTVSVSYADTIAQCLTWGLLVQSRSKLAFSITASGQQGATIASYSTSVNGTSYNSASFTTDVLLYNGTNSYTVTVTDSRGLQTVSTGNFTVVAYSNPSLTLTLCDRNDSDPDQVDVAFDFSVASVSSNNDANYRLDYKLKSASTWTNGTVQSLGAYSGSISDLIANLDGGDEWDIRINVIDSFQTASVESEVGVAGNILLNSRHNGGLGLLMKSQADNQLDIGKPTVHHGAVLEQFGSSVASHSASGNYAKVVTFGSSASGGGKNLLNESELALYSNWLSDVATSGTSTSTSNRGFLLPVLADGTYTLTFYDWTNNSFPTYLYFCNVDSDKVGTRVSYLTTNIINNQTYTFTAVSGLRYFLRMGSTNTEANFNAQYAKFGRVQLEVGSTSTAYEPYADTSNINVNAPITLEYARTADSAPTRLTINFNRDYSLASFTSDNSVDAFLMNSATATWNLYIGKASASDSVEILDMHNPWSNTDMTITWEDTSISTLPTGYVTASLASIPNTYGDLATTGRRIIVDSNAVSPASETWKTASTITLSEGVWLISAFCQFNGNATGQRQIVISTSQDSGTQIRAMSTDRRTANASNATTTCRIVDIYYESSTVTYYMNAWQNSGSALTVYGRIYAVKIA